MGKWAVIYSSVTGNTKKVAEAIAGAAEEADIYDVKNAPEDLSGYEVELLGYWLRRGGPDPLMEQYLPKVHDIKVALFETHGAKPGDEHVITAFPRAAYMLGKGCEIVATFGCRGKINPKLLERRRQAPPDDPHGGAKQAEKRFAEAASHPDDHDIEAAKEFARRVRHKIDLVERFNARQAARLAEIKSLHKADK